MKTKVGKGVATVRPVQKWLWEGQQKGSMGKRALGMHVVAREN